MRLKELAGKRLEELYRSEAPCLSLVSRTDVPPTRTQGVEHAEQWNSEMPSGQTEVGRSLGPVEPIDTLSEAEIAAMPLAQFARSRLRLVVHSKVLGETVVFAADNARLDPGERRTVYRAAELRALAGLASLRPGELRQVHRAKRTFKGTILA